MSKNYLFISDIHLGLESREVEDKKEKLLVQFLEFAQSNCDELFIVGDLFDYWFEYKRVYQKGYFRTLTALKNLTEKGIIVHYFIGNHDFLHRNFFKDEIGAVMYKDACSFTLNDKKFFIGHGDGLVQNDTGYKIVKWILRNKSTQWLYSKLHPDFGIWLASRTSKSSRAYTTKKDYGEVDGLYDAAREKMDEGFDYVIFGHLHKKVFKKYKNSNYVNLGSWLDEPCYGKLNEEGFQVINWG